MQSWMHENEYDTQLNCFIGSLVEIHLGLGILSISQLLFKLKNHAEKGESKQFISLYLALAIFSPFLSALRELVD